MSEKSKTEWEYLRIGLDPEDLKLLNRCVSVEKLSRSDVIRRALREFAKKQEPESQQKVA